MTSGRGSRLGVPFTYTIHGGEVHVSNKNKSVTRATVELAFERAIKHLNMKINPILVTGAVAWFIS